MDISLPSIIARYGRGMIVNPGWPRLHASTVAIEDPGSLLDFLTPHGSAFLRGNDGFVALGEIGRCEASTAAEVDAWWKLFCERIENESEMPGEFGTGPLLLASFPFDERSTRKTVAIVPETVIGRRKGVYWLSTIGNDRGIPHLPERQSPPQSPTNVTFDPGTFTLDTWMDRVDEVASMIREGQFSKIRLARDLLASASSGIDPRWVLSQLIANNGKAWAYQFDGLVGCSRELMIHRRDGLTTSRIMAGMLPRVEGMDVHRQTAQLMSSHRDLVDHRAAVHAARDALSRFFTSMHIPEAPFVLTQPSFLQLTTDLVGVTPQHHSTLSLMAALHPTGVVYGAPAQEAFDLISQFEGMDRERYSGPIGWMDAQGDGDWMNALNCGQVDENQLTMRLFASSGVVADSDAHRELVKTEARLSSLKRALAG